MPSIVAAFYTLPKTMTDTTADTVFVDLPVKQEDPV